RVAVPAHRTFSGYALHALNRRSNKSALLLRRHCILWHPARSVARTFVPAPGDLPRHLRVPIDRLPDHERGDFDLKTIEQVQQSRNTFQVAVLEIRLGWQVWQLERHRDGEEWAEGTRVGPHLAARLEHQRNGD